MSTETHVTTRESLEKFKEAHPELDSVVKLFTLYPVARGGEEDFVHDHASQLEGGSREARQVYRMAANIQEKATLIWANINDAVSPYFNQALFNNIPEEFILQIQSIPGYDRLFESLDYVDCDHFRSIFGPSAYFVDLMRFVETNIAGSNEIPNECKLNYRRPDLYNLRLDCSNANDLIPYIDLVNKLLEIFIKTTENAYQDAYEVVKDAIFPMHLPFNLPLGEIRSYLKQSETSLYQIYKTFENPKDANMRSLITREFLELSRKEFSLIISEFSSPSDVSKHYGDVSLTGEPGLENVDVFLEQTQLTRQELNELIFQDLDRHEVNAGLSRLFFVNNVEDGLGALRISQEESDDYEKLINLSPRKLDRIYRFVKLSRKLGWSFTELDWSLRSLQESYIPEKIMKFDGINDYVACQNVENLDLTTFQAFTIEAWINPARSGRNAVVGTLVGDEDCHFHFFFGIDPSNELIFRIRDNSGDKTEFKTIFELKSSYLIPLSVFTHIAVVVGDSKARLYMNGKPDKEEPFETTIYSTSPTQANLNIGKDLYDEYFDGYIKEVRIWQCARSQAAIEDNRYRRFTGREQDLAGYWPLTENQWKKLIDLTPNGNDGIMGGEEFVTQPKWVHHDLILDPLPDRGDGKGYRFNGVDQYLAAREVEHVETNQLTLEAWVKTESDHDNYVICMGDDSQNPKFALWIDTSGKLTFDIGSQSYESDKPITSQQLTHVCVVLKDDTIRLYIDGTLDKEFSPPSPVNFVHQYNLNIGRSFDDNYFKGIIKEVRLWNKVRTDDQIALYMYHPVPSGEPGLIGYWCLDEVEDGIAKDLSYNQNHLYLGGLSEDYMPERKMTARLPEPASFPISLDGTVLQFDGDNDVIVIRNPNNWGLGRYERLTLELWFNAADEKQSDRKQVIFAQGDAEAGLNIYLYDNRLHILTWNNNFEGTALQQSIFKTDPITYGNWHHIAVTNDEFPTLSPLPADKVEFRAYLDGDTLKTENGSEGAEGRRLSPVGPAYLGGLGQLGITRFEDAYSEPDLEHLYFFGGQVTDLRLWKTVKTADEIDQDRYFAPTITEDLVAYFAMDEGEGWLVHDLAGERHDNQHIGTLQKRNIALITDKTDPELVNVHSHYADPEALEWKDYVYAGRMRITDRDSGIGVSFLSRYPEDIDQYYALRRDAEHRTFHLVAHPHGVQNVKSSESAADRTDSGVEPEPDTWYRFLIEVKETESRTGIRAKVWPENGAEPEEFQIDAYDNSDIRITSGTVGVWTSGTSAGEKQFDNLGVWPASINDPKPSDLLLDINFEAQSQIPEPEKWRDTGDRLKSVAEGGLFKQVGVDGSSDVAFGTDSTNENVHSHYNPTTDVLEWKDYVYQGKMRITDPDGGIGVTFLSRYPEDIDQYYALRRDAKNGTFHLVAHPHGVQNVKSSESAADKTDSGIEPVPNMWYRFRIEVEDTGRRTEIRAKVWPQNELEPAEFQIEAYDSSSIRITSGTVGVWASDAGSKYFDNLKVYHDVLLSENFDAYSANEIPENWIDIRKEKGKKKIDGHFKTFEVDGNTVFGTESKKYIHSHYSGMEDRENYVYTGKMRITDQNADIGVTVFYKDEENYYQLSFNLHKDQNDKSDKMREYHSKVSLIKDTWYRFLIEGENTGTQTEIRAKIWSESEGEPTEFQIEAYDDSSDRLTAGTVGVWARRKGSKYFDDLEVVGEVLLSEKFGPEDWSEVGSRDRHWEDGSLFRTVDVLNNNPRWTAIEDDYPVLLRPLSQTALQFDGQRKYLATEADVLELSQFTVEAWIYLSEIKESPILSLGGKSDEGAAAFIFGIDSEGHLKLERKPGSQSATGTVSVNVGKFVHVAFRMQEDSVTFFVNGEAEEIIISPLSYPFNLNIKSLEIGRDLCARYFEGKIKEVRIWKTARSSEEISSWMYQRPFVSDDLVGYWSLEEDEGVEAKDASINENHMRLGGLESARKPVLVDLDPPEEGFWRSQRNVLDFNDPSHIVSFNDTIVGVVRRRRAVEVWFRVEDKTISNRKQVIYQEGDAQRGLNIYVYDGSLYLGGYNIHESQWQGTWLHTDRIESCRWHHAVLVLDGRGEVREESLQAFLDGKLVDVGPGSQLWEHRNCFTLGGIRNQVLFHDHDGKSEISSGHYFKGQILDLRVWNTIRTVDQIQNNLYSLPTDDGESSLKDKTDLVLWWQFDDAADKKIPDLSGNDHVATFAAGQLKPIELPHGYKLPSASLDALALNGIAAIKGLKEQHRWSVDRLTALWHSIKHIGKEDQTVLFDQIFNQEGSVIERWDYYMDQPIRWDKTGEEDRERDRQIRSRLMGALRVSHDDLNAIVEYLSGEDEKIIELDNLYLTRMYQLAQLAGMLRLKVSDFFQLLLLVDKSSVDTLQDVVELDELARWMKNAGLGMEDFVFLTHDPDDLEGGVSFFKDADVRALADELIDQAESLLIKGDSFRADQISQAESVDIFDLLRGEGLINEIGAVMPKYSEKPDFGGLLIKLAEKHNWIREFDVLKSEFDQISDLVSSLQIHEFIDSNGLVLVKPEGYGKESLMVIFESESPSQKILDKILDKLPRITEVLELRKAIQDQILSTEGPVHTTLQKTRDDQRNAVLSGLANMFDVQPDLTSVVFDYFRENGGMDASQLLNELKAIRKSDSLSETLAAYLAKLSKVFYLASVFELTASEVEALLENPEHFSLNDVLRLTLQELDNLFRFKQLQSAFNDTDGTLIDLLSLETDDADAAKQAIANLTGWEPRQVGSLVQYFDAIQYNNIAGLSRMKACFDLAKSLQVDIDFLIQFADTTLLGTDEEFGFHSRQAALLLEVLRAKYTDEKWPKVYKPIHDQLAVQRRDALLGLAMLKLGPEYEGRNDPDIFHQYFLLDLQVGSEVETSRIVQATASLQLYIQRCLMNMENGVDPATIPADEWEWIKNYRVWEANRKVFLYPENYIEPELRDTKTPLFEELEQELMQADITQESVEVAFTHYLDKFAEIANLKIVGSYLHTDIKSGNLSDPTQRNEVLYLIGRTDTEPRIYYLREHIKDEMGERWLPWKKIDLVLNSDFVTPVYAFGKLFLFWTEFTKLTKSGDRKLSDRILDRYTANFLSSVFTYPISDDNIKNINGLAKKIDGLAKSNTIENITDEIEKYRNVKSTLEQVSDFDDRHDLMSTMSGLNESISYLANGIYEKFQKLALAELIPNTGRFSKLNGTYLKLINFDNRFSLPSNFNLFKTDVKDASDLIDQYQNAKCELEAELSSEEIGTLQDGKWKIDKEGYLFNIATVQRMQETINVYNAVVKYSYLNFSKSWIQPQTYVELDNELTEEIYRQPKWERLYAQQVLELLPEANDQHQPKVEKDVKVLKIDEQTQLIKWIPKFDMEKLTWEFWVKFINEKTEGWPDSISEDDVESLQKSVKLIDYDNGNFNVTATNKITSTGAYETAEENATEDAVKKQKWESETVTLNVQLWGKKLETDLDYDTWQHIAIMFEEINDSYSVTLHKHKDGTEIRVLGSLTGQRLPSQKLLVIGDQEADVAFISQMSEFRLWNDVRDIEIIKDERNYRKNKREKGLFYLPLNVEEPDSIMTLVESKGFDFIIPVLKGELLNRIAERERIILFYGDQTVSLRNNLKDQSFNLKLQPKKDQKIYDVNLSYQDDGNPNTLPKAILHLTETKGLSINDFATGEDDTVLARPADLRTTSVDQQKCLLQNLEAAESSFADVNNQPGWYIVDLGDEQFLVKAEFLDGGQILPMPTMAEISKVNYDNANNKLNSPQVLSISYELEDGDALLVSPNANVNKRFKFERLNTFAVHQLSKNLFTGGIDTLLSLESQHAKELDFWKEYTPNENLVPEDLNRITKEIDFQGAYRLYFEEIFFHIPFLIANKLNSNQNFADSQKWYHYIFNPTASEGDRDLDRYWRYLPFRDRGFESLKALLTDSEALSVYREDPFDPHTIAALRLNAYQKAVVMKYIDNLLDWGDALFTQDTRESITEALMLYVLAYDLLGPRPKSKTIKRFEEIGTYEDFIREYEESSEFLTEMEKAIPDNVNSATFVPHSNIITDFCVPENAKFIGYWDRVEDRLFKIRHSLNIEGTFRQLALFEPPINPMALVRAVAGGAGISGALSELNVPVPHYRYSFMLEKAKEMTSNVMGLGSALLVAIESRDAEQLAILQNTHEKVILNLMTSIKENEIDLAKKAIEGLEISKQSSEYRKKWYQDRIDENLNDEEIAEFVLMGSAQVVKTTGATFKAISAATAGIPELHSGGAGLASPVFLSTWGGSKISKPFGYTAEVLDMVADSMNFAANIVAKAGAYKRRKAGWEFEKSVAEKELEEIEKQIAGAEIQLAISNQEIVIHSKAIQQNQDIEYFYRSKFSNEALYNWMIGRLSGLYFQAYKLAYDMAKSAEKALQYELPTTETYITPSHWDSLKKGLLSGESLMLELSRMEKSHLDQDSRFLEIEKTISMKKTFPGSLLLLATKGVCEFPLREELFDKDYLGHYFRVIKSIEIDIKTSKSLKPYESVNATLIQLGNKTLMDPDIDAVKYLIGLESEQPDSNILRVNWRANQQIAVSKVNEKDDGMFILNFFWDDRYFPFEGTGVVSSWRLEIPKANNPDLVENDILKIDDVLIHLRYTAKFDRGAFKTDVEELLQGLEETEA